MTDINTDSVRGPGDDAAEESDIEMRDDGPRRLGPERSCIVTRERLPIDALIRFVAGPDGSVVPDLRRKLPGRGVWVEASKARVETAVRRRAFARGLKADVKADAGLPEQLQDLLLQDALQALALANKAGSVTVGFSKVEAAIANGAAGAILEAADAAADGVRKIGQAIRRASGQKAAPSVLSPFTSSQMSLCLGREHVIHVCLENGPAAEPALAKCLLFLRYRGLSDPSGDARADLAHGAAKAAPGLSSVTTPHSRSPV